MRIASILAIFALCLAYYCEAGVKHRTDKITPLISELYDIAYVRGHEAGYQQSDIDHAVNVCKKRGWIK